MAVEKNLKGHPLGPPLRAVGTAPVVAELRDLTPDDGPVYRMAAWLRLYGQYVYMPAELIEASDPMGSLVAILCDLWPRKRGGGRDDRSADAGALYARQAGATVEDLEHAFGINARGVKKKLSRARKQETPDTVTFEIVPVLEAEPLDPAYRRARALGAVATPTPAATEATLDAVTRALYRGAGLT